MKRLYYSSFLPGLEKPIERLLYKEGGISVERVSHGGALYRSVRTPEIAFVRQTFLVLARMKPVKNPDEALKRLLSTGGWLDNIPFEMIQGKRFRITISDGEKKIPAGMRYVNLLENAISEQTGLYVNRERPDVELWVLCREDASFFLWRMDKTGSKDQGRMRPDLVSAIASYLGFNQTNATVLGCEDEAMPAALRRCGAHHLTCVCPNKDAAMRVASVVKGAKTEIATPQHTEIENRSQDAVYLHFLGNGVLQEAELRSAMHEAARILTNEGRLVIAAPENEAKSAVSRNRELQIREKCVCNLSGRTIAIWAMALRDEPNDEEAMM